MQTNRTCIWDRPNQEIFLSTPCCTDVVANRAMPQRPSLLAFMNEKNVLQIMRKRFRMLDFVLVRLILDQSISFCLK